jgi:hypothetical protein
MIRIAVTQAAFDAICATLPLKGVAFEGERLILDGGRSDPASRFDAPPAAKA